MRWVLVTALMAATSFAESQCRGQPVLLPADGATNVPLNAMPRGVHVDGLTVGLIKRVGDVEVDVPVEARRDNFFVTTFVPHESLLPNTEYVLTLAPNGERHRFTTGDVRDETAPTLPGVSIDRPSRFDWRVNFDAPPEKGTLVLVHHGPTIASVVEAESLTLRSACQGFFRPVEQKFDLDVHLMDVAGNVSAGATVRNIDGVYGCSSAPGAALMVLVLTLFRRGRS